MTREEMIKKLSGIIVAATPTVMTMDMGMQYDYITAEGAGTMLGSIGEWPAYKFNAIDNDQWIMILQKIRNHTVTEQDFEGTDIGRIIKNLHSIYGDFYNDYYSDLIETFEDLLTLPEPMNGPFFCLLDVRSWGDRPVFFSDEQKFMEAFRDNYCDNITEWEDMDDEDIQDWVDRLDDDLGRLTIIDYTDPENDDEFTDD